MTSPTKTSADAYRRIHEKVSPMAIDFLNSLEGETGADQVKMLTRLLVTVWDDGFDAAQGPRPSASVDEVPEKVDGSPSDLERAVAWLEGGDVTASSLAALIGECRDYVYEERDKCVALIAKMAVALGWRAGMGKHEPDPNWDPAWMNIVFIDLPNGQISWHLKESEMPWFAGLPIYEAKWDGHSTPEKYERMLKWAPPATAPRPSEAPIAGDQIDELRLALRDAIEGSSGCVYGPGCEDCWVCRAKTVLASPVHLEKAQRANEARPDFIKTAAEFISEYVPGDEELGERVAELLNDAFNAGCRAPGTNEAPGLLLQHATARLLRSARAVWANARATFNPDDHAVKTSLTRELDYAIRAFEHQSTQRHTEAKSLHERLGLARAEDSEYFRQLVNRYAKLGELRAVVDLDLRRLIEWARCDRDPRPNEAPMTSERARLIADLKARADIAEQAERFGGHVAKYALADGLRNIALEWEQHVDKAPVAHDVESKGPP